MNPDQYRDAVDYVAKQLKSMVKFIEQETGRKLDEDRLYEVMQRSNEAREWFLKAMELRKNNYPLVRGIQMLDYSVVLLNIWGTDAAVDIFKSLYEEMQAACAKGGISKGIHRIVWIHLRPYYDNTIINYIEKERGAYLVHEMSNWIFWDAFDPADPYRSLARKMLSNPAYSPVEVQFGLYEKYKKPFNIDGMIGFTHKGCRHLYSSIHMCAEHLKDVTPWLVIDGDCIDPRAYSFPLVKTRIDAFFDMLDMKKERME
jgi:benzoyl-CoA reductase/2-hydroxyglutaryl-CoA dehydratase subunit BcrC/BadD/HgdB